MSLRVGRCAATVTSALVLALAGTTAAVATTMAEPARCEEGVTRFVPERSPALDQLSADRSWTLATGKGVVVAVIDSGVSTNNIHFPEGSVLPGKSFVEGPATADEVGHGTAIAGLIAGRSIGARSGVVGLAKDATILPVRVIGKDDQDADRLPRVAEGIRWAADNGARVMNLSLSTPSDPPALNAAIAYAVAKDVVVVASAGNRATASETTDGERYPAAYPGVIGVTATDADDVVTNDSIHGPHVALAAPGYSIVTAYRDWGDCVYGTQGQSSSFATGYVSAAAALLRQRFPQETAAQITHRLEVTAARAKRDARDDTAGWGVIQPYDAMTLAYDVSLGGPPAPGQEPRVVITPRPQALDLSPTPDPRAVDKRATLWMLLLSGAAVLGLSMWGMLRRARATGPATGRSTN